MYLRNNHTYLQGPFRYSDRPRPQLLAPLSKVIISSGLLAAVCASLILALG